MANITNILGTDSVSSSRVIINDNFASINNELADIAGVLDTTNETISLSGAAAFGSVNIANNKVIMNATAFTTTLPTTINNKFTLGGASVQSIKNVNTGDLPLAGQFAHYIYNIDGTAVTNVNLNTADAGQEIVIVAEGGDVTVDPTNIAGVTGLTVLNHGAISLKFLGTSWYIAGSYNCTII